MPLNAKKGRSPHAAGPGKRPLGKPTRSARLDLAVIGMEAEFALLVDDEQVRPETVFDDPQQFVRDELMHRQGTSYHVPTGGAVYFDGGVIEIATPLIEIERGCAARAGRSLWESILYVRRELDAWEERTGKDARLVGFSAHYNCSFDLSPDVLGPRRSVDKLAYLLSYVLPVPVMLLAANRRSTAIGVRPRPNRVEITADFTPSAALMIAAGSFVTAVVRETMQWPSYERDVLGEKPLPVVDGYRPAQHTSRDGWRAQIDSFPQDPFSADVNAPLWPIAGSENGDERSLRALGSAIFEHYEEAVRELADPFTLRLMRAVFRRNAPSLLDLPDRPSAYEDVGVLCTWDNLFSEQDLERSRYERVLIRAIGGQTLRLNGERYEPIGMRGWSRVVFHRASDDAVQVFSIDFLAERLEAWEPVDGGPQTADRRYSSTSASKRS
jgi:hypothetical protein